MNMLKNIAITLGLGLVGFQSVSAQGGFFQGVLNGVSEAVSKGGEMIDKTRELVSARTGSTDASSEMSTVAKALEKAGYFTEKKAGSSAQYYIFICSASWCPPCRALMPHIVDEYNKNMKKDESVSLVLLGGDSDEAGCKKYLEHYKADIPGIHAYKKIDLPNFPGIKYWPFAIFMDAEGNVITSGHGSMVLEWKKHIKK